MYNERLEQEWFDSHSAEIAELLRNATTTETNPCQPAETNFFDDAEKSYLLSLL